MLREEDKGETVEVWKCGDGEKAKGGILKGEETYCE